jgi:hypothetical protein
MPSSIVGTMVAPGMNVASSGELEAAFPPHEPDSSPMNRWLSSTAPRLRVTMPWPIRQSTLRERLSTGDWSAAISCWRT